MEDVCDYIMLDRDIFEKLNGGEPSMFSFMIYILFHRNPETNTLKASYRQFKNEFNVQDKECKKILSRLREERIIELYKVDYNKNAFLITVRPREDLYHIDGTQFYLPDDEVFSITGINRGESGYAKFRNKVLDRDGYKCRNCGSTENLEVHHIKSYAKHPRLRTTVSNGITLCRKCHHETHSYRSGNGNL